MSKTYRRTRKGRKLDWVPPYHIRGKVDRTKEELLHFTATTKIVKEERTHTSKRWSTGEIITNTYTFYKNRYELEQASKDLENLIFWENNPHRIEDKNDYFEISYAKNPGHWNHWTYTKRRRAHDRKMIQKIKSGYIEADEAIFYHKKKPVIYYW